MVITNVVLTFSNNQDVKTAGTSSKFGIPLQDMDLVKDIAEKNNIKIVGLHAHIGSILLITEIRKWNLLVG